MTSKPSYDNSTFLSDGSTNSPRQKLRTRSPPRRHYDYPPSSLPRGPGPSPYSTSQRPSRVPAVHTDHGRPHFSDLRVPQSRGYNPEPAVRLQGPQKAEYRTSKRLELAQALARARAERETAEASRRHTLWMRVWNSHLVLILSYFLGTVLFVAFFHAENLPRLSFPVVRNLADWDPDVTPYIWWTQAHVIVEVMWGFTHIRKTFLIVVSASCLPEGSTHKNARGTAAGNLEASRCSVPHTVLATVVLLYHAGFGLWMGWANNVHAGYYATDMEFVLIGLAAYVLGEGTVTLGTLYFIRRREKETALFRGFRLASDFLIWAGFAVVSMTLPAVILLLCRFLFLGYFLCIPERPRFC